MPAAHAESSYQFHSCPYCQETWRVEASLIGSRGNCSVCGKEIAIAGRGDSAAAFHRQSARLLPAGKSLLFILFWSFVLAAIFVLSPEWYAHGKVTPDAVYALLAVATATMFGAALLIFMYVLNRQDHGGFRACRIGALVGCLAASLPLVIYLGPQLGRSAIDNLILVSQASMAGWLVGALVGGLWWNRRPRREIKFRSDSPLQGMAAEVIAEPLPNVGRRLNR